MGDIFQDDELDRQLREAMLYIDDAGFTSGVLAQLPTQTAPARVRGIILMAAAILASVLAYFVSGGGRFVSDFVVRLSETPMSWLLVLLFTLGVVIGAIGLAAAISKSREPGLLTR
jgi:hypothetical protein